MEAAEIKSKMKSINGDINDMEAKKEAYKKLETKIKEAIDILKEAKQSNKSWSDLLKSYYTSQVSDQKVEKIQDESDKIQSMINDLRDKVLVEVENQITLLGTQISNKQDDIKKLEQQAEQAKE